MSSKQYISNTADMSVAGSVKLSKYELPIGPPDLSRIRMFLHGEIGEGKTSFAVSFPKVAVLEYERKAIDPPVVGEGTKVFYAQSPSEWVDIANTLALMKISGDSPFDMVAIDTATSMLSQYRAFLTKTYYDAGKFKKQRLPQEFVDITAYGEGGAGWTALTKSVTDTIDRLYAAGYGWIVLSHLRAPDEEHPDGRSALNAGLMTYFYSQADCSGYLAADVRNVAEEGGGFSMKKQFVLSLDPANPNLPARSPLRNLPSEIILGDNAYEAVKAAYDAAKAKTPNKQETNDGQ